MLSIKEGPFLKHWLPSCHRAPLCRYIWVRHKPSRNGDHWLDRRIPKKQKRKVRTHFVLNLARTVQRMPVMAVIRQRRHRENWPFSFRPVHSLLFTVSCNISFCEPPFVASVKEPLAVRNKLNEELYPTLTEGLAELSKARPGDPVVHLIFDTTDGCRLTVLKKNKRHGWENGCSSIDNNFL